MGNKHFIIPMLKVYNYDAEYDRDPLKRKEQEQAEEAGARGGRSKRRYPRSIAEAEKICEIEARRGQEGTSAVKLGVAVIRSSAMRDAAI